MTSNTQEHEHWGQTLFRLRDYTPIPLILLLLLVAEPTVFTATLGTLTLVCGELIRIYSVAFIGSISRTRKGSLGSQLVTSGPFQWVRNPLYLGNFFITTGLAMFSGHWWFLILTIALFAGQYYFIIRYEEKILLEKFGIEYSAYRARVPAWFPRRVPGWEEYQWPDSFTPALQSERRTLMAIGAVLLLMLLR